MYQHVVFFEVQGGSDKGEDGHRRDTMPMIEALQKKGWTAEVMYYSDDKADEIYNQVSTTCDAYISRVNPGNIPGGESKYFKMLRRLSEAGVVGMPHPDTMINFGAKDALVKLRQTKLVPEDTYAYYSIDEFKATFPTTLSMGERVLKQNRGSTGEGIWRVYVEDNRDFPKGEPLPLDTKICCTEAVDNHMEHNTLGDFMTFCERYIVGENGMLVDMRFLSRITEGEVRILLVGSEPVFVVHKKPADAEGAFSATLFSGAKYTYDEPSKWQELVDMFQGDYDMICEKLKSTEIPLIWTADFILDYDDQGNDTYVLGEMNCSCVGFTSHLDMGIQDKVADQIIATVTQRKTTDVGGQMIFTSQGEGVPQAVDQA